jgi:diguanylate cyclase (GGDEF)-like protein/PAS domain S-box-containing protein
LNDFFSDRWIVENIPNVLCIKSPKGHWLQASQEFLELLGLEQVAYQGKTNKQLCRLSSDYEKGLLLNSFNDEKAWSEGTHVSNFESTDMKQKAKNFEITTTPVYLPNNEPYKLFISGTNLGNDAQHLQTLKLTSSAFDYSLESQFIVDPDFKITRINRAFCNLTGHNPNDVIGYDLSILNKKMQEDIVFQTIRTYLENHDHWQGELSCENKDGLPFPAKLCLTVVGTENSKKPSHFLGTLTDITEQKSAEKRFLHMVHYDDLTQLPNRVKFIKHLNQVLSSSKRHKQHCALIFIDLDHFKSINDTIGHQGGDDLLREAAQRLTGTLRQEDIIARLSGDEFAVLLFQHKTHEESSYAASKISNKVISLLAEAFYIQRREVFIGASIGIAIYPEDADNSQDLLKHADIAMYQAKNLGRNNYHFFKQNYIVELNEQHKIATDMRLALSNKEFHLFYQPQYGASSKELVGAEVLVRWIKPDNTIVPPFHFIPLAEETGLIIPLGKWILEAACKRQKQWLDEGYPIKQVSVNISAKQFTEPDFINTVKDALEKSGLAPKHLELEITESMLMGDIKKVIFQLQRLHDMGISLSIDDFGTGYSSLSYLKDFPIEILKIDQSFVRDIPNNPKDIKIVLAIIEMGHSLGLRIVAEGVETEEQLNLLSHYKCDIIQGYYFSKPLPEPEMTALLAKINGKRETPVTPGKIAFSD